MGNCIASALASRGNSDVIPHQDILHAKETTIYSLIAQDQQGCDPTKETSIRRSPSTAAMDMSDIVSKHYAASGENDRHHSLLSRIFDVFDAAPPAKKAAAFRPVTLVETTQVEENGHMKPWAVTHYAATQYKTCQEMKNEMIAFGKGLVSLGLKHGETLALFEDTRYEWLVAADGAWTQGLVLATVYANLGEDALLYAIREAEVDVMLCNAKAVDLVRRMCTESGVKQPILIFTDSLAKDVSSDGAYSFQDVLRRGSECTADVLWKLPSSPDQLALIMYTSGTTGEPKGVMLTHGNLNACAMTYIHMLGNALDGASDDDAYVAYLPLAHIFEFAAEHVFLIRGRMLGYSNPKTLTNAAAKPHGDLAEFKPTFFVGVPRVFETVKKAIEAKLPPLGTLRRSVYEAAFKGRVEAIRKGQDTPYWNSKVFAAPRELFGGRLKGIFTGGAPMSASTQEFLEVHFGCSVSQGYALTECSCGTAQRYWQTQNRATVGGVASCSEIKLRDVEGYTHHDELQAGEVCIRGATVAKGYFKQPEKTKEVFQEDGWFYTGDVGQWQTDGSLRIIGRVKALAKNACGEYIALDVLESIYVANPLAVPNGVCVVVDPLKHYIAALLVTDEAKARALAEKNGLTGFSWPAILDDVKFIDLATRSLAATASQFQRRPFEVLRHVKLLADEWTPENGVLTAAMKLKRRIIDQRYAKEIAQLFNSE